jgi:hypothetical protein
MVEFLQRSFQEHSIAWIVLSGVIGAAVKFLFDEFLGPWLSDARAAAKVLRRYRYPLLRAADTLDRRLENFVRFADRGWFNDKSDDYYRLSTLYVWGGFFAWAKILEDAAFIDFLSSRRARNFSIHFYRTFKALTGFNYFPTEANQRLANQDDAVITRLVLTAIGELMVTNRAATADGKPAVLEFVAFTQKYPSDEAFKRWFGCVERFLGAINHDRNDPRWNRLLVFATNLRIFVTYLDPRTRQHSGRSIPYLGHMHLEVAKRVRREIELAGHADLLPELRDRSPVSRRLAAFRIARRARRQEKLERAAREKAKPKSRAPGSGVVG